MAALDARAEVAARREGDVKILYLCPDIGIPVQGGKGAALHVRALVGALEAAGHRVVVAAPKTTRTPWDEAAAVAGGLMVVPPEPGTQHAATLLRDWQTTVGVDGPLPGLVRRILYDRELLEALLSRFEKAPPDLIYERASIYGTAGVQAARSFGCPLILETNAPLALEQETYRGSGFHDLAAAAERWTLSRADAVVAVSSVLADYVESLGVPRARVHVVPNGVDISRFHPGPPDPAVRTRWTLPEGPLVGFVGGLRPWHGVESLPALLAGLREKHPRAGLVIVGDGPLRERVRAELASLGLDGRAVLTGAVGHDEIAPLLREMAVAVAPYPRTDHGFYFSPLKLFEYMACGVCVVASASGQIADVVTDGETGLLYPPGDTDALQRAVDRALADDGLRARLGRAAARVAASRHTWAEAARRVLEIAADLRPGGTT